MILRANAAGFRLHARQFYDSEGKKREQYLAGPVGTDSADTIAETMRERIK